MIKTDKSLDNIKEIARYDTNGVKLNTPQKGVNIILYLYSDVTSDKVIEKQMKILQTFTTNNKN